MDSKNWPIGTRSIYHLGFPYELRKTALLLLRPVLEERLLALLLLPGYISMNTIIGKNNSLFRSMLLKTSSSSPNIIWDLRSILRGLIPQKDFYNNLYTLRYPKILMNCKTPKILCLLFRYNLPHLTSHGHDSPGIIFEEFLKAFNFFSPIQKPLQTWNDLQD